MFVKKIIMEQKEIINQTRRKYLEDLKKEEKKAVVPNHKYVKNFGHLISIINTAIANNDGKIDMNEIMDDPDFIFNNIYKKPFCDQYTWLVTNDRPDLLLRHVIKQEVSMFITTNKFCGKVFGKTIITIPEHLKDK